MPRGTTIDFEVERGDDLVALTIEGEVLPFVRGRTWGPPEDCYPDEGGTIEIVAVLLDGDLWDGELTPPEVAAACESLAAAAADQEPDDDDGYDDDYEPYYDEDDGRADEAAE
jgi:hypothetical protein